MEQRGIAMCVIDAEPSGNDALNFQKDFIGKVFVNHSTKVNVDDLFVTSVFVDGASLKYRRRMLPAPMGRAFRVVKRTAHLTVAVTERPQAIGAATSEGTPKRRARAAAAPAGTPRRRARVAAAK